jgi:PadR family transcriptional regulator AphA
MSGRNRTRYAVLGALSQQPMSGYDVKCVLETIVGHFWHESFGQIYPILRQLVAEGLATVDTERGPGRPQRHVYTVTARGTEVLNRWLSEPVDHHQRPRHELLLKLFFGAGISRDVTLGLVERHREEVEALLATYGGIETELQQAPVADDSARPFWLATLRYGQLTAQATLSWCDETAELLRGLAEPARTAAEPAATGDPEGTPPATGARR